MEVRIRGADIELPEALRAHVERRLQFALSRFGERIGRVSVRLVDINGARDSKSKGCLIAVSLRPAGRILVEEVNDDLHAAINRAAERTGRAVSRELELERAFDGAAPEPPRSKAR